MIKFELQFFGGRGGSGVRNSKATARTKSKTKAATTSRRATVRTTASTKTTTGELSQRQINGIENSFKSWDSTLTKQGSRTYRVELGRGDVSNRELTTKLKKRGFEETTRGIWIRR